MLEEQKLQQGVQSLEVGLRVLNILVSANSELMLRDIAIAAKMHPSKVHRYLVSLVRMGYVQQNEDALYGLGSMTLRLGLSGLDRLDTLQLAQPHIKILHESLKEGVLVAKWTPQGPLVLQWIEPNKPLMIVARVGTIMPLLNSATGRVFAAYLPEDVIKPLLENEWVKAQNNQVSSSLSNWEEFVVLKQEILTQKIASVKGILLTGVNALAVPVFNHTGNIEFVITGLGHEREFDVNPQGINAQLLRTAGHNISTQLGCLNN